jgi:hypothetical protein
MDEQLKWLLKVLLTGASLVSLIETGRRRGWL